MVHGGNHGNDRFAVGKAQNGDLGPLHELLDDDTRAALTEGLVLDHGADGGFCFLHRLRDDDALAERESVRLDDDGRALRINIGAGGVRVGEELILCRGDAVFFHQILGKCLARLDDGSLFVGAEARDARLGQRVHRAEGQWIVRRDDGVVDPVHFRKFDLRGDVLCADLRHADRVGGDAAVTGQAVNFLNCGIFF